MVDERSLLAINYTSGTTGRPKGVMYHHRGAYLQALAMAFHVRLAPDSRYLWTLPMFHCDGWCFPWAVTAAGGTHVCLRAIDADEIWRLLRTEGVTPLLRRADRAHDDRRDVRPRTRGPSSSAGSPSPPGAHRPRRPCSPA